MQRNLRNYIGLGISTYEQEILDSGKKYIIGVDENGTGSLTFPIVSGAVVLDYNNLPDYVCDSKLLRTEADRERAYKEIRKKAIVIATGVVEASEGNTIQSTHLLGYIARLRAVLQAAWLLTSKKLTPEYVLLDHFPLKEVIIDPNPNILPRISDVLPSLQMWPHLRHQSITKGDTKVLCIAAASIVGKVFRDEFMKDMNPLYPEYEFNLNKGYRSTTHVKALKEHGLTDLHKVWFTDCKHIKKQYIPIRAVQAVSTQEQELIVKAFQALKNVTN